MARRLPVALPLGMAMWWASSLQAQATISGTITDRATGLPLAQAQVFIGGGSGTPAITNDYGKYRIEGVRPGRTWLMIRRIGYAPARSDVVVAGDGAHTVYVGLEPFPVTLPEVEVRGAGGFGVRRLEGSWNAADDLRAFMEQHRERKRRPTPGRIPPSTNGCPSGR